MAKKIFEKAGLIPGIPPIDRKERTSDPQKPRTAPGTMLGFLSLQSTAIQDAEHLRERVRALEGETPLRKLDPANIGPTKWANRHEASFATQDFLTLKEEIAASNGNVQPIKVRPHAEDATGTASHEYQIVYGHRRHRACLELGLPVLATVEAISDLELFEQMERENRGRQNLSAWEQGVMYRRALDDGLYPSLRRLSEALGVDVSQVSKSVMMAKLPEAVIGAFATPLDIQFRWATPLAEAVQKDPDGILQRAKAIVDAGTARPPQVVFAALTGIGQSNRAKKRSDLAIRLAGKKAGVVRQDATGRTIVEVNPGMMDDAKRSQLVEMIERLLAS